MREPNIWRDFGALDDIPRQGACTVATPRGAFVAFRTLDNRLIARDDKCPHKGSVLSQGIVHGRSVICPLHNWMIDLTDGKAMDPDEGCVGVIAVRLEGRPILLAIGS